MKTDKGCIRMLAKDLEKGMRIRQELQNNTWVTVEILTTPSKSLRYVMFGTKHGMVRAESGTEFLVEIGDEMHSANGFCKWE